MNVCVWYVCVLVCVSLCMRVYVCVRACEERERDSENGIESIYIAEKVVYLGC